MLNLDFNLFAYKLSIIYRQHLRTLKIPGKEITSLSWEGKSLRIAMAVDSFIYFANIRPDYMWCYFAKTVAYLNANGVENSVVTFWDTISNQVKFFLYIIKLLRIFILYDLTMKIPFPLYGIHSFFSLIQ